MKLNKEEIVPLSLGKKLMIIAGCTGVVVLIIVIITVSVLTTKVDYDNLSPEGIVETVFKNIKIIDGRNSFPSNVRDLTFNDLSKFNFSANLSEVSPWAENSWTQTDLQKLKDGKVGAQFWVATADCKSQNKDGVIQTLEQIDLIKRLTREYNQNLSFALSSDDIENAIKDGKKIASLIAVGGGHLVQSSLAVLRMYYDLGVRYMTIASDNCSSPWVDSSSIADVDNPVSPIVSFGLTAFGGNMIFEMNRLGMIIDLSYSSKDSIMSVLHQTEAPVIFSHSGAAAICNHHNNLNDDLLKAVQENKGLIMIDVDLHNQECKGQLSSLEDVAEHIDYIRNMTNVDHVGIGGNFDGTNRTAKGLEDPSKYQDLFLHLAKTKRWTVEDLEKLGGRNLLRVFKAVEEVRDKYVNVQAPLQITITRRDLEMHGVNTRDECITSNFTDDVQIRRPNF